MRAIYKRDLASYFRTMSGYVFFALFFVVAGYAFSLNNIIGGSGSLSEMFGALASCMTAVVPFLTARIFMDSREVNTEQMLYVSSLGVLLAKFGAVMTVLLAAVAGTWIYVGILSIFGSPYLMEIVLCQIGLLLLFSCVSALTMFVASIAHRKMQAFVMLFAMLLVFFVANSLLRMSSDIFGESMFRLMGMFAEYSVFETGVFSLSGLCYMLTFTAVFLLLACMMLERKRERGL